MTHEDLRIDGDRLLRRISDLAAIGPIDGGGSCRLALTDEDRDGRDLVVTWMHDLGPTSPWTASATWSPCGPAAPTPHR